MNRSERETDQPFQKRTISLVCPVVYGGLSEVDTPESEGFSFQEPRRRCAERRTYGAQMVTADDRTVSAPISARRGRTILTNDEGGQASHGD